jgi:hypothetical protein
MRNVLAAIAAFGMIACLPAPPNSHGQDLGWPMPTLMPTQGLSCGAQTFSIITAQVPPNVFLLVDRSGSMADDFGGAGYGSKWDAAQSALNGLLNNNSGKASWGLSLFPPNPAVDQCGKAGIDVSLQMGDEAAIAAQINALNTAIIGNPRGSTPTADAFKTVRDQANLSAHDRNNYVVLVTDGLPVCNNPSDVGAVIDDLYNRTPSVKTFVVGIGAETASNPQLLNQWAEKGHTARTGQTTEYYQANDAGALVNSFDAIIGAAASCTYKLQTPPADPTLVVGQLDGVSIASDAINGFTYDPATQSVTFHGTACGSITSGKVRAVNVEYGCPPPQIL